MTSNIVLSNTEYKTVGKRPVRHDGYDKVTGKAQYSADSDLPGSSCAARTPTRRSSR